MKILFLGDSITNGSGASCKESMFIERVGQMLGCEIKNFGIGGSRIAENIIKLKPEEEHYIERAKRMDKDADFVFIFGGTNDYGHGDAPFGDFNGHENKTFCGDLNNLCEYLINTYGIDNIAFILPIHRYNELSLSGDGQDRILRPTLRTYVEMEKSILMKYEINFLDLDNIIPVPNTNKESKYFADGLHPNDYGHELIARACVNYLKEIGRC